MLCHKLMQSYAKKANDPFSQSLKLSKKRNTAFHLFFFLFVYFLTYETEAMNGLDIYEIGLF